MTRLVAAELRMSAGTLVGWRQKAGVSARACQIGFILTGGEYVRPKFYPGGTAIPSRPTDLGGAWRFQIPLMAVSLLTGGPFVGNHAGRIL